MPLEDLVECGVKGGCTINYKGTKYWCQYADKKDREEVDGILRIYCEKLCRMVPVGEKKGVK